MVQIMSILIHGHLNFLTRVEMRAVLATLEVLTTPFIDVGMRIELSNESLGASCGGNEYTDETRSHPRKPHLLRGETGCVPLCTFGCARQL